MSRNRELADAVEKYRFWFIQKIIEHIELHGNRDAVMRLTWPSPTQLKYEEIVQWEWECPPARCIGLEDYKKEHGADNEKWKLALKERGDKQVVGPHLEELVELNDQKVWTRRKKIIQQAVLTQDQGGQDELGQKLASDRFAVLANSLENRAFGSDVKASVFVPFVVFQIQIAQRHIISTPSRACEICVSHRQRRVRFSCRISTSSRACEIVVSQSRTAQQPVPLLQGD